MIADEALTQVLDWIAVYAPPSSRTAIVTALNSARAEDGSDPGIVDYWRTVAETLVADGQLEAAREALKKWQALAPADHPIHAVLGGGPPPAKAEERKPMVPLPKREEPNHRIVRVIDSTYTFKRIAAQYDKVGDRKVVSGWEVFLDPDDKTSRAVLNEYDDHTYGPWAVSGVFTDFAGAAAVEVVVRSMQRHSVFTSKKSETSRRMLTNVGLPLMAVVGVIIGYVMGVLH
ncbi:M48 family metallopeptidase [Magnetospirillum sp. UT-4]|uniref:tetratricopeptide repeat protein n=1 Tax=Magnetospirillum sp. UT-4 TaxID=2681467 RepID=UPI001385EC23|nr:hypothetical protein [Magnetospirillum sp. UT-4]CAA7615030.1 conserved hypothetical protein [Magnetospirillum sp. UT-4]